jgi:hypothetical protein
MLTVQQAREIIGEQPAGDYTLDLDKHIERYQTKAPLLASLLASAPIKAIREEYHRRDNTAIEAQAEYKRVMQHANLAILIAAGLGALTMAAQIVLRGWPAAAAYVPYVVGALGVLSAISGGLAARWLYIARVGNMLEGWMGARAAAETQRLSYFVAVGTPSDVQAPDLDLTLLRLEYFRRYQLDLQQIYYEERGRRHRADAQRTLEQGGNSVMLSAVASLGAGIGGAAWDGVITALGAVGVFAAAWSAYTNAKEALSQDRRNGERYERTRAILAGLAGRLDDVRKAVSGGNEKALSEFVSVVNDQISLEHRQWLDSAEQTKNVMAKLDDALKALQQKPAPKPGGGS